MTLELYDAPGRALFCLLLPYALNGQWDSSISWAERGHLDFEALALRDALAAVLPPRQP